jgi:uncharacterized protein YndB with AHSA1/START domain
MTAETITIQSSADAVFRLISDPMRTGEWSPECVACRWIAPAARAEVGARFRGTSRNGWRRWRTTSEITEIVAGERFAWEVTYFRLPVARWEYRIREAGGGVELSQTVDDQRGRILRTLSPYITGSRDRAKRNAATMNTTLEAIKAAAEALS